MRNALEVLQNRKRELFERLNDVIIQGDVCRLSQIVNELLQVEKEDPLQYSRAYWLCLGDQNTKFFVEMARERQSTNSIYKLMGGDNKIMIFKMDMEGKCLTYFSELFTKHDGVLNRSPRKFPNKVSNEQNKDLTRVPTLEEVKSIVDKIHVDKSPRPDGFNGAFFFFSRDFGI